MENYAKVRAIFWVTLVLNLAIAASKLFLASRNQSLSLFSDGLHSLMDGASNVIALISLRIAERPPDADHPYGHRKFETLGAMGISGLLCLAAWEILNGAWARILKPLELPTFSSWYVFAMVGMMVVNIGIARYEQWWGTKLKSPLLLADAAHTQSDAFAAGLALIGILAAAIKWYWVDTLAAILIVGLILWAAYRIIRDSVLTLSDAQRLNPGPVKAIVEGIEGVENCHKIRSHGPEGQIQVDLHIVVSPTLSAQTTFEIENEVTRRLREVYPGVSDVTIRHQTKMPPTSSA